MGVAETNPCGVAIMPGGATFVLGLYVDDPFIVAFVVDGIMLVVAMVVRALVIDDDDDDCCCFCCCCSWGLLDIVDGRTTPGGVGKAVIIDAAGGST